MRPFARVDRVRGLIRQVLSDLLLREIKDPRLHKCIITDVKMSKDLKNARIFFATSGSDTDVASALSGFDQAKGYIKRLLASELNLRYMPDISFFYDNSFDYGARIEAVLKSVIKDDEANLTKDPGE